MVNTVIATTVGRVSNGRHLQRSRCDDAGQQSQYVMRSKPH